MYILIVIGLIGLVFAALFAAAIACDPVLRKAFVNRWIGGTK